MVRRKVSTIDINPTHRKPPPLASPEPSVYQGQHTLTEDHTMATQHQGAQTPSPFGTPQEEHRCWMRLDAQTLPPGPDKPPQPPLFLRPACQQDMPVTSANDTKLA